MLILSVIITFFLFIHFLLIETYRRWFLSIKIFKADDKHIPSTFFTVIIPARNEEQNIGQCLQSVLQQNYPNHLFEVIVADDFSSDSTPGIVHKFSLQHSNVHCLSLKEILADKQINSYKKKAIELAIQQANGSFIVTTDADCIVQKDWLKTYDAYIQQNGSVFIAAPVKFTNNNSFVSIFQCLDFLSLQGITAAAVSNGFHSMCNGANVAYSKKMFNAVGGFKGIDNIASGDDMLLMHKVYLAEKDKVHFLFAEEAIVSTPPMPDWRSFFNQRVRWASKADKFKDKRMFTVLLFIYLFNLLFLIIPLFAFAKPMLLVYWIAMLIIKTLIELRFMVPVARFFKERKLLWYFPSMQIFHILYTVIAGWLGKFGKYSWKGRVVK